MGLFNDGGGKQSRLFSKNQAIHQPFRLPSLFLEIGVTGRWQEIFTRPASWECCPLCHQEKDEAIKIKRTFCDETKIAQFVAVRWS